MALQQHDQLPHELVVGPVKIKDGLFMGDQIAAKDIEFIISNKVTHIINTVALNIGNLWEMFDVRYLSVGWTEQQNKIFNNEWDAVEAIFDFIESANERGQSCLVHSINGKTRASVVIIVYLMRKYKWSLSKSLQFIQSRKAGIVIRQNFRKQLSILEAKMGQEDQLKDNWHKFDSEDEQVLNNTYKNSVFVHQEYYELSYNFYNKKKNNKTKRIVWKEELQDYEDSRLIIKENRSQKEPKPILRDSESPKITSSKILNGLNEKSISSKNSNNMQGSLEKLLFESGRRGAVSSSIESENTNKEKDFQFFYKDFYENYFRESGIDCNQSIYGYKQTNHARVTKNVSFNKQSPSSENLETAETITININNNQIGQFSKMKANHYKRVMACYETIKQSGRANPQSLKSKQYVSIDILKKDKLLRRTGSQITLSRTGNKYKKEKSKKINRSEQLINQDDFMRRITKTNSQKSILKSKCEKVKNLRDKSKANSVGKTPKKIKSGWTNRCPKADKK